MMAIPSNAKKEYYTEAEAAQALNISVARLRQLLDENVFNDGKPRPDQVSFRLSDIILLEFWNRSTPNPKIVAHAAAGLRRRVFYPGNVILSPALPGPSSCSSANPCP